jgi:hypothetical protein
MGSKLISNDKRPSVDQARPAMSPAWDAGRLGPSHLGTGETADLNWREEARKTARILARQNCLRSWDTRSMGRMEGFH